MTRSLAVALGVMTLSAAVLVATLGSASDEPDELMPGKVTVIKGPGTLAKFVAKPISPATFALPAAFNNPTIEGGTLQIFDTSTGGAGSDTYNLPSTGWHGLGSPPGMNGFKYVGAGTLTDPCRVVLLKKKVVKGVCRGAGVTLAPGFVGDVGVILTAGTDSKRYCARFGGTNVVNGGGRTVRRNAPAVACPSPPTTTSTSTSSSTSSTLPCCGAERITLTSSAGTIRIDNIVAMPFPGGAVITLDTGPATPLPDCGHDVVIPAGGISIPHYDFTGTGFCTEFVPLGCQSGGRDGKGRLWDGAGSAGLALTNVLKQADTSDGVCNPPGQPCNSTPGGAGANTLGKLATTHSASSSTGVRTAVEVPIHEVTWSDSVCNSAMTPGCCVSANYGDDTPGNGEILIFQWDFLLSLTTDVATGAFVDMNSDGCKRAGAGFDSAAPGPDGPKSLTGTPAAGACCTSGQATTLVAVGETLSGNGPFYDLGFKLQIPATVSACGAPAGGNCVLTTNPCLGSPSGAFLELPTPPSW